MSASPSDSDDPTGQYHDIFHDAEDTQEEDEDYVFQEESDDDGVDINDLLGVTDHYHDAESGGEDEAGIELLVQDTNDGGANDAEAAEADTGASMQQRVIRLIMGNGTGQLTQVQVINLLRNSNLGHLVFANDEEDQRQQRQRRRQAHEASTLPQAPCKEGTELMNSGRFGATELGPSLRTQKRIARRILDRELGIGTTATRLANEAVLKQSLIPSTPAEMVINYHAPVYSGQFSDDGNFFYSVVKDFKVRMYDTSNPYRWRHYKTVEYPGGSWTLTDASLSPDNKWLAYTSIQSNVCLAPTDPKDTGDPYMLNLASSNTRRVGWRSAFGIWSVRFSGDGRELVAGTNANAIIVYDIESRTVLHQVAGHDNDVNAVCFADRASPHLLYSGSDDTTIKVWDRRSMGDGREAGAFVGHIEGLTYLDSKGDGRYVLSNGKDQSMKLWDLRMMYTTARYQELRPLRHTMPSEFDYRWEPYSDANWYQHPHDNSLVTYRQGHKVLKTLIRCHFAPPGSTDARYVYTGSHDGHVYVYNIDGTVARKIDVQEATQGDRAPRNSRWFRRAWEARDGLTCVRDASWHPNAPFIAASALQAGDRWMGTVSLHSFNEADSDEAEPKMGLSYNEKLKPVSTGYGSEMDDSDNDDDDNDDDDNLPDVDQSDDGLNF